MKVSRAQAEQNRARVIETASKLFREKGFDGVGINELMQVAGLTRGGFYGQFDSKQHLELEACQQALADNAADWQSIAARRSDEPLADLLQVYLSTQHQKQAGSGCALAALAGDAARQGPAVQARFADGVEAFVDVLAPMLAADSDAARRETALAAIATMVGALMLARAVGDNSLAREIRRAAQSSIQHLADTGTPSAGPGGGK